MTNLLEQLTQKYYKIYLSTYEEDVSVSYMKQNCHYVVFDEDEGEYYSGRRPCFVFLPEETKEGSPRYLISYAQSHYQEANDYSCDVSPFIDYCLNHSPWSRAFLTKNIESAETGVVLDCSLPARYIIQAAQLIRMLRERSNKVELWCKLHKLFPSMDRTCLLVFCLNHKLHNNEIKPDSPHGHDIVTNIDNCPVVLNEMINFSYDFSKEVPAKECFEYRTSRNIWYKGDLSCYNWQYTGTNSRKEKDIWTDKAVKRYYYTLDHPNLLPSIKKWFLINGVEYKNENAAS